MANLSRQRTVTREPRGARLARTLWGFTNMIEKAMRLLGL